MTPQERQIAEASAAIGHAVAMLRAAGVPEGAIQQALQKERLG